MSCAGDPTAKFLDGFFSGICTVTLILCITQVVVGAHVQHLSLGTSESGKEECITLDLECHSNIRHYVKFETCTMKKKRKIKLMLFSPFCLGNCDLK